MNKSVEPLHAKQVGNQKPWRPTLLAISISIGALAFAGSILFLWLGAGTYGSPLAGDIWFNTTLFLIVLLGPMAVLPCTIVEKWWPTWGGIILCNLSIPVAVLVVLNNMAEWGFDVYDSATGTLCLAVPMFVMGTLLWHSNATNVKWAKVVWWIQVMILGAFLIYFAADISLDVQLFKGAPSAETYLD